MKVLISLSIAATTIMSAMGLTACATNSGVRDLAAANRQFSGPSPESLRAQEATAAWSHARATEQMFNEQFSAVQGQMPMPPIGAQ